MYQAIDYRDGEEMERLDILGAIQAHILWKKRLQEYIHGHGREALDADHVGDDHNCALGQWIHDYGEEHHGHHPRFIELKETHAAFHRHAAEVIRSADRGELQQAQELLQRGDYCRSSNRIKAMLARLSLDHEFS